MSNLLDIGKRTDVIRRRLKEIQCEREVLNAELEALNGKALAEASRMRGEFFELAAHETLPDGVAGYRK
ncbi:hypothetical protein [Sulfuricurvum sp.]|uniref:hypothetical protein n=1 Tax=Sulfuricurvum sp. TaxID=2025608 RepID=UPI003564BA93